MGAGSNPYGKYAKEREKKVTKFANGGESLIPGLSLLYHSQKKYYEE